MIVTSVDAADVKFTADQCRVMKQVGVDTTGLCPNPKPTKKRTRMKR